MPLYELQQPHTHAGREYAAGDSIEVRASIAQQFPKVFAKPKPAAAKADVKTAEKE